MSATIGLDIGHSAVKVSLSAKAGDIEQFLVPTAVCRAITISEETEAARVSEETVTVDGADYFFGRTAEVQGGSNLPTGLSEDWISTAEHNALMLGCFKKAQKLLGGSANPRVVVGLPSNLYGRQREQLRQATERILGVSGVKVIPQPVGPYFERMLDASGVPSHAVNEESWGMVEIGYFTTDFMLMQNGRWVEKASGGCSGARVAAEHLQRALGERNITADLRECETALREKFIRNFGERIDVSAEVEKAVDILTNEVIDSATRLMEPYARRLDGVVVAGGGAAFMFDAIHRHWPHAVCPQNPRLSVAEGMRRYAALLEINDIRDAARATGA